MSGLGNNACCTLCPRECRADRTVATGACGAGSEMRIAKIMTHIYEEPPISGTGGSGAIFFSGCNLRCGYCQNAKISRGNRGKIYSAHELVEEMLHLQDGGVHNINLVTAAHFLPQVAKTLLSVKPRLRIPVVYNSSGYEKAEALQMLDGLVDVYLPDFKYIDAIAAKRYSDAADYPDAAIAAIAEMTRQTGEYVERDGLAVRGTIIRHLVLPGLSRDGEKIMRTISEKFPSARVSIMSQYTPDFNVTGDKNLDRKVTSMEYRRVVAAAEKYGLKGYMQYRGSATADYTPDFND